MSTSAASQEAHSATSLPPAAGEPGEEMVRFTLLENALDSAETGLTYFHAAKVHQKRRDHKQCLLNLFQAAELLMKAVLSLLGPGTIFMKKSLRDNCVDPVNPTETELHRCKSVNIRELRGLVKKYYPDEFSDRALQMLDAVSQTRNNLQHFALLIRPDDLAMQLRELYQLIFRPAFILLQADEEEDFWNSDLRQQIIALETQFLDIVVHQEYTLALCPVCESWSHFILYEGEGYPLRSHCICCNFRLYNLTGEHFHTCPECDAPSVIYVPQHQAGACLWYKCYYSKEGGFVPMEPCACGGYRLEDRCDVCDPEDE